MRKFLLASCALTALAVTAWAQSGGPFTAPSQEIFMGPSIGKQWQPANSYVGGINSQTGTSYTLLASDKGKLVVFNNSSPVAVTLPQAGTPGFDAFAKFNVLNLGAGTVTVTPTTSTINGGATKTYAQNTSGAIVSDGTNYYAY